MLTPNEIVYFLKNVDCINPRITKNNNIHFSSQFDHRPNTVEYTIYKDDKGFCFRRIVSGMFYPTKPYQLFRSRGNKTKCHSCFGKVWYDYDYVWEHFNTIEDAVKRFNKYITNIC